MNVFDLRKRVIDDYRDYVKSFISIADSRIRAHVDEELDQNELLWPQARIGLNPAFAEGARIDSLVADGTLHTDCSKVFRLKRDKTDVGAPLTLHLHQVEAIQAARSGRNYALTTGTGSGKSLAYIIPIVDHVVRSDRRKGIKAIVVYPMNALANSQEQELRKFLEYGFPDGKGPVTFRRYTGQESDEERLAIVADPPDILLTNYVMLELILTRTDERQLVKAAKGLRFLVLDELHTYRGRQGADVALLVRRTRDACEAPNLQHVGTSATMASGGSSEDQRREVARVASLIFGAPVGPADVIVETLRRATQEVDADDPEFRKALAHRLAADSARTPTELEEFIKDPLSRWIEATFGLAEEKDTRRLIRATPRSISGPGGAAEELADLIGVAPEICRVRIEDQLLAGWEIKQDKTGFPIFAFRLHQFISRGDTAFASLEPEDKRVITVHPQKFVPDDRARLLFPLTFCRECGQEYYSVRLSENTEGSLFEARPFDQKADEAEGEAGYLYVSAERPWTPALENVPQDWIDPENGRVKYHYREQLPRAFQVRADGRVGSDGMAVHMVPLPFRFCLRCGVTYGGQQRSDFTKLGTLGSEGRSTATTILSLSTVRHMRRDEALRPEARKLLSFTDNRQDASLQAGHFNDFVQIGLLRSALYRAAKAAGPDGLTHDVLTQKVFDSLALPIELYAKDPSVRFAALHETQKALRDVLGYRLYLDLRRGWRITSPNLEQTDLLRIEYVSLQELAAAPDVWQKTHPALAGATPEVRVRVGRVLLDFLRRSLAIKVDYLDRMAQERLTQVSSQWLKTPWGLDENEKPEFATIAFARPKEEDDWGAFVYLSSRGGFGQFLGRKTTFPAYGQHIPLDERATIIQQLLEAVRVAGLVQRVREPDKDEPVPGYQLTAATMRWVAGEGRTVLHDPIRVPKPPEKGSRPNAFFLSFYRHLAEDGQGLEAREHTAQVPNEVREDRERRFRDARLPILYCSPTMELGVDIASLNVVNMRNVPPTPANYAQRSGRAGRSGQPALVITYCSAGSPHDQYFFRRPERMVAGHVTPPRLDLANEDLVRAHAHAVWLTQTGMSLHRSLKDILDLGGDEPTLDLQPQVRADVEQLGARERASIRVKTILNGLDADLARAGWWGPTWLDDVFKGVSRSFEDACGRWKSLYRSAKAQFRRANKIIEDPTRGDSDRNEARKLRREAEAQLDLLLATGPAIVQSDFYSYRYFASEGFLPGYSFPRLPLSAFIPGRRGTTGNDEFLSRPRFLAISEFGPRNLVYHEGSRYQINRVILPVSDATDPTTGRAPITTSAKLCGSCGYFHLVNAVGGPDLCESCGEALPAAISNLFRLQNVSTRRRDRINSDEEERQRQGYDLQSAVRFGESDGRLLRESAAVIGEKGPLASLAYGHAARIWRLNKGWKRRRDEAELGFVLDVERGYWAKDTRAEKDEPEDALGPVTRRVVPFVEDSKNCLVFTPEVAYPPEVMASLQAALKSAIQVEFQLEDGELAAESLPNSGVRRHLLLYEAAEGGAGVLRRLVEEPSALQRVARRALEICHFDPETGVDQGGPPWRKERCEAACYDCLMSYYNQPDHKLLDRKRLGDLLGELLKARVEVAPTGLSRDEQFERLNRVAASDLERRWLQFLMEGNYRLPTEAARLFPEAHTRCDFFYAEANVAVYVDGAPHDFVERQTRDAGQQAAMEDLGYIVLRFRHDEQWDPLVKRYPSVFGVKG
jgi:ATP-dependent helicase YprA (DUF1998 family)